jgi:hypothetical protein
MHYKKLSRKIQKGRQWLAGSLGTGGGNGSVYKHPPF